MGRKPRFALGIVALCVLVWAGAVRADPPTEPPPPPPPTAEPAPPSPAAPGPPPGGALAPSAAPSVAEPSIVAVSVVRDGSVKALPLDFQMGDAIAVKLS